MATELSPEDQAKLREYFLVDTVMANTERKGDHQFISAMELADQVEESYANWGKMQGISTGYRSIDRMTMGLVGGELSVIGGATSMGKTALAINLAAKVMEQGHNVLFVTLEMTKTEAGTRFRHIAGSKDAYDELAPYLIFQKRDDLNWRSIDGLVAQAIANAGIEMVVIDHLHYFTRELQNVAEDLGNITKELKKNAIRHNIPVILLSHTRKSQGTKTDISDLRGSSYIAQDADIVLMVERDRDLPRNIAVTLEKNRNRHGLDIGTRAIMVFDATRIYEDQQTAQSILTLPPK
jgi:replicative DNA helicase